MAEADFGERYYREDFGRPYCRDEFWLGFYRGIADAVVSRIAPRRVLDVGCAMGFLVEALRERGVEACGFDLSSYARQQTPPAVRSYCWQASVTDEIEGAYDLIICLEVLPHLPLDAAERAVANLCRHADDVLFSVYPYGPAPLHANTAPPSHWAGVFARHEFYRDFAFDGSVITPWAVRYRKGAHTVETAVSQYEHWALTLRSERDDERAHRLFAEQTIRNMQKSAFWRARDVWQRLKALGAAGVTGDRERRRC